jgi:hypothetical protein
MVALKTQRSIRLPVIGVVKTSRFGVSPEQLDDPFPFPRWNREDLDVPVALQDPKDNGFARNTPTTFPPPSPAKRGLVALDRPIIGHPQFFLVRTARARR